MFDDSLADVPMDGELYEPETRDGEGDGEQTPVANKDEQATDKPDDSPSENDSETENAPSQEGANPAEDGGKGENPSSEAGNTPGEDSLPFNKHPRWQEVQDQLSRLKEENETLRSTMDTLKPTLEELKNERKEAQTEKIPEWFANIYGEDNHGAWANYKADLDAKIANVKDEIRREMEAERQQQVEETEKWQKWMQDSLATVEQKYQVSLPEGSSDRNAFLKYVLKYRPTDEQGNIDFNLGYELYAQTQEVERLKKSEKSVAKKKIAAATTSEKTAAPESKTQTTHKTLRKKSFLDLALESLNE